MGIRILAHLDPDGEVVDDCDRQRRRNLWINHPDSANLSKLTGHLTPEARAVLEMALAAWGKPGMNNPDDPHSPHGAYEHADSTRVEASAGRDLRSTAQRHHDALIAILTAAFTDGTLGSTHRGLPMQVIIKADLSDLLRGVGVATTATGATVPIRDLLARTDPVQPFLAVFADASEVPLWLGRSKRLASLGQRLMSFARPSGQVCSAPKCDQAAAYVELDHAEQDWAQGGRTEISELAPACPKHHHMVGDRPGQYTTGMYRDGPLAGRWWWRRNTAAGEPANPKLVNDHPDVVVGYRRALAAVRADIHGPAADESEVEAYTGALTRDADTPLLTAAVRCPQPRSVGCVPISAVAAASKPVSPPTSPISIPNDCHRGTRTSQWSTVAAGIRGSDLDGARSGGHAARPRACVGLTINSTRPTDGASGPRLDPRMALVSA